MTLHKRDRREIPPDTFQLGQKLLDEHNPYRLIGDRLGDLISDDDYADLYASIGGPAISPALLALVTVFQMVEKLPDRQAAEAVKMRIDWKYALHLELDDAGFSFTNLSHFRQRLIEHQAQYRVFDRLLALLVALGYVRRRGRQRTDSTYVLGLVAQLSRLELVWETLRVALRAVEKMDAAWIESNLPEVFMQRYGVKRSDYNLTKRQAAQELSQAGADGFWLLAQLERAPQAMRELRAVETLKTVWQQQFEQDERGHYQGPRKKVDAHGLIQSPHDPEVRYRKKRGKPWKGFSAQVSETAEDKGEANFITDAGLTDAQRDDSTSLPAIQERLEGRGLLPSQQIVDQNYISGPRLAESEEKGVELVGPVVPQPGPPGFKLDDFQVDLEQGQATCPAGKRSVSMQVREEAGRSRRYMFAFGQQCLKCPSYGVCTQAKQGRTIQYDEYHPYIQQRRTEMETETFRQAMQRRPPIEGTLSQLVRQGIRRARYRGLRRVDLQLIFTAVGANLKRLCQVWASGKRPSWASP
jgi:transposase